MPISTSNNTISELQNLLHKMLMAYMNGARFRDSASLPLRTRIRGLIEPYLVVSDDSPETLLSDGYQTFQSWIKVAPQHHELQTVECLQDLDGWATKASDPAYLKPIAKMARMIQKNAHLFSFAGIHGSFSTLDYVKNFSDLDTILIIKFDVVTDPVRLKVARRVITGTLKYLYQMSVFQHHNHFVLTEIDLQFYPNDYFPVELFLYTTRYLGKDPVINVRNDIAEKIQHLKTFREFFGSELIGGLNQYSSLFDWVLFNQFVLLLPALWYGLIQHPIYKKYSFQPFYDNFNADCSEIVQRAEQVRNFVRVPPYVIRPVMTALSAFGRPSLFRLHNRNYTKLFYRRTAKRVYELLGEDGPSRAAQLTKDILEDYHAHR